jgi:hypothetical protein
VYVYNNSVRTSQGTLRMTNRLMMFRETVAVYCENYTEHINTLCGQNAELFLNIKARGTRVNHCALKSELPFVRRLETLCNATDNELGSSVSTVTRLLAGRPENKEFVSR